MADRSDNLDLALQIVEKLNGWQPTIPDEVTEYFMRRAGFAPESTAPSDPGAIDGNKTAIRAASLATEMFLSRVVELAWERRASPHSKSGAKRAGAPEEEEAGEEQPKTVLALEDVVRALQKFGINMCKPEYILDQP